MIQKKICLLGSLAVGKTSLVRRFVKGVFSDRYLTTIGVKIDKKTVEVGHRELLIVLWDISGEDEFSRMQTSYLRGASGCFLVVDGTRPATLDKAIELRAKVDETLGEKPCLLVFNKTDLTEDWRITEDLLRERHLQDWRVRWTSAKTGEGVESAFLLLGEMILSADDPLPA